MNWYGESRLVKITYDLEGGDLIFVKCFVNGKEVVKYFHGKWSDKKGRMYDRDHFYILRRCCMDNFKDSKNMNQAFMPIFSILFGEDM